MKFSPEKYRISDEAMKPFIDPEELQEYLDRLRLGMQTAYGRSSENPWIKNAFPLPKPPICSTQKYPELIAEIKKGARTLKDRIYGNRIVLFAPLYIGNKCVNNCRYCGFRTSNKDQQRITR
ncbi:MAG: hypothetical protein U5N56_05385 [Candidatus Marinimicrobia bacterium]|nr:hypothetical protein [Candidatus Neomarinimicrobiota bacterium]